MKDTKTFEFSQETPNPKVPQMWACNYGPNRLRRGIAVRIVYPNGYIEVNTPTLDWESSFLSSHSYKVAVANLKSYGHEFLFNIE